MLFGMSRKAVEITLNDTEREQLERWSRGHQTPRALAERAPIILWAAQGMRNDAIREKLGCRLAGVSKWRRRFAQGRGAGLSDALRPGQPVKYGADAEKRLLTQLDSPPPHGYGAWNGRLLAPTLGVSADGVWATLRRHDIRLPRRRSWGISTDPEFTRKAADIVALYLHPPENAVVLSVDASRLFKRWRAPRAGCGCPTARPSPALVTNTSGRAPPRCLPPCKWRRGKCRQDISTGVDAGIFWPS